MIHKKEDIKKHLNLNAVRFYEWVQNQPDEAFIKGPQGKWTTGQHLDHLIKSVKPLNQAFLLPRFVFRWLFGKPNRPGRNFEMLVVRYNSKIQHGGKASGQFIPPEVKIQDKKRLLEIFIHQYKKLADLTDRWSEEQLDAYILPHPLLGKLTVREMLFFTLYHLEHHLRTLDEYYEK